MKETTDKLNAEIAQRLHDYRLKIGLSQELAAAKFDIAFSTYKRYESGKNGPDSEAIAGMMRAGMNANWLLTGEGDMLLADEASHRTNQQKAQYRVPIEEAATMAMAGISPGDECVYGLAVNENTLNACLAACSRVHGDVFDALPAAEQIGYAADLYNLLVKMSAQNGGLDKMKCLESNGMVELLNVFIRLGWARKFPPPPKQVGCFF